MDDRDLVGRPKDPEVLETLGLFAREGRVLGTDGCDNSKTPVPGTKERVSVPTYNLDRDCHSQFESALFTRT